jgi:hypothetical protein
VQHGVLRIFTVQQNPLIRNQTCQAVMDTKFKAAKKEKLPAPAKEAKTFMDALALVRFPTVAPTFLWFSFIVQILKT